MHRTGIYLILAAAVLCLAPQAGYAATLVGHWAFEGNGLDSSGNHNDATAHGNVAYASGMYGQAAQFHGGGDYFQIPNNPGLQLRSGQEFSVAAYVNAAGLGQQNVLIHGLGCSTWASWFLGVQGGEPDAALSPGNFVFATRSSGGTAYTGAVAPAVVNEWAHLAATYDGSTLKLYLNGEEQNSVAAPLPFDSAESLYIGGDPGCGGRSWFTGLVDEVYIFNQPMTTNQVRQLASGIVPTWVKAGKPNPPDGTVGVSMPLLQWTKGETAVLHDIYLGTSPDLTAADLKASRQPVTMFYYVAGFQPGATYYWRVDEIDKDGVTVYPGDVWSFVAQALTAYYPTPADQANDFAPGAALAWMPPAAATGHHVYLSGNRDAVTQGAAEADKGTVTETSFTPTGLEPLTTYYWRVDETIAGGEIKTGPVWSFTTCLPIDDFESYTDDLAAKTTIFDTWIDGLTDGLSGSIVGNAQAPFAEQTIVHGGKQSMPMDYNNVKSPFYSEATREFAPTQDWTAGGVDTLILYVRGRPTNRPAPAYVTLADASKNTATVASSDPSLTTTGKWVQWKIPLSQFTGVNLARVKAIALGVGDRANPAAGGTGRVYVDDLAVSMPAPGR
jgi:hypothetical protein